MGEGWLGPARGAGEGGGEATAGAAVERVVRIIREIISFRLSWLRRLLLLLLFPLLPALLLLPLLLLLLSTLLLPCLAVFCCCFFGSIVATKLSCSHLLPVNARTAPPSLSPSPFHPLSLFLSLCTCS